jgi:mono/diheme cytochrome c family protein
MRRVLMASLLVLAVGCAPGAPERVRPIPGPDASVDAGRRIAEVQCAGCHAIGPAGESRNPEAPPFRTLSRHYPVNALEEAFAEGILVGHPAMPQFRFTPAQIDDILAYLQSVQERRGG